MQAPLLPVNEEARLAALNDTQLLDTPPEARFDTITALLQKCLKLDIVLVSLVDQDRQWFKSKQGLDACETARDISFCGHTILGQDIFEVPNALTDPRFADNPLVTGEPNIRFYAGVPLQANQQNIGTLCIIAREARVLTSEEKDILREFGHMVEQAIRDRLQEQAQKQLVLRELRYRSVLEGTRIGTWEWNVQTGETTFNERWAEMVGYTLDDLAPISIDTWLSLVHPEDGAESSALLQAHFDGELEFYDCKCRMRHRQGHWIWVHDRGRVVSWTPDGKPLMMYGTHSDISEQKRAEQELQASRDQYRTLVSNIPGITYRCLADEAWTMLYMSEGIDPLSGYPAEHFIHNSVRTYSSVIHPEDRAWLAGAVDTAVAQKVPWKLHYRVMHRDGRLRFVEERGRGEYDETGKLCYLDGFIIDITNETSLKQQLLKLAEQLPGVVYQFQQWPDGRSAFPYASAHIMHIYGVTPEQVKHDATPAFHAIVAEDLPATVASIERSRETLCLWQHEYRVMLQSGEIAWMSGRATPEAMPDGSVLWHGYIYDITERKNYYLALERANDELQLAQRRLELSSKQTQIGYWQASLRTGSLWWSPMIYDLFALDANEIQPSVDLFKQAVHPEDLPLVEASEARAQQTGLHDVVHRIIRADGEIRWVHELAQMLPEDQNPELIMIGSVQDITERMRLQQVKDEFIATVSHELRTPLTSINGALKLLQATQNDLLTEKGHTLLNVAISNANRLQHIINDLLDIEKLAAGKMQFETRLQPVLPILQRTLQDHVTYAAKSNLRLQLITDETLSDVSLVIDEHRLLQILANLLSNAMKYSPENGIIELHAHCVDAAVEIAITDQGEGVPEAFKDKLFQRFSQADASSAREKGGTGLGLALTKELTEAMHGELYYDASYTAGARFVIRFPIP